MDTTFSIGELVRKKMKERERKTDWLAKKINCHRNNIYKIYRQEHIHPELLLRISIILNHNFFSHYFDYVEEKIG